MLRFIMTEGAVEPFAEIDRQLAPAKLARRHRELIQCAFVDGRSIQQPAREAGASYWRTVRLQKALETKQGIGFD